jgi:hypothetical protein
VGGGDGSDPPYFNMEKDTLLDKQKEKGALATKVLKTMKTQEMI